MKSIVLIATLAVSTNTFAAQDYSAVFSDIRSARVGIRAAARAFNAGNLDDSLQQIYAAQIASYNAGARLSQARPTATDPSVRQAYLNTRNAASGACNHAGNIAGKARNVAALPNRRKAALRKMGAVIELLLECRDGTRQLSRIE